MNDPKDSALQHASLCEAYKVGTRVHLCSLNRFTYERLGCQFVEFNIAPAIL
jgi:hypothetical protein